MRFEFIENGVIVQRESVFGKIASMNLSLHGRSAVAFLTAYANWRAGDLIQDAFANWRAGDLIQDAFSWLDDGEREFLMTGLNPSEWDRLSG